MSATPAPPHPTAPAPERKGSLLLWVLGLIVAAIVILGLGGALIVFYLARQVEVVRTGPEGVEVRTPLGSIRANRDKAETGLPEYPGARMTDTPGTVEISGPEDEGFLVTVGKYRTANALATVDEWYRGQLASSFERESPGTMVRKRRIFGTEVRSDDLAYIEEKDDVIRFVVIRRQGFETEIVLARLGKQEVQ